MLPPLFFFLFTVYSSGSTPYVSANKLANVLTAQSTDINKNIIQPKLLSHGSKHRKFNSTIKKGSRLKAVEHSIPILEPANILLNETDKSGKPAGGFLKDLKPMKVLLDKKPAGGFLKDLKPAGFFKVDKPAGFLEVDKPAGFLKVDKPAGDFLKVDKPAGFLEVDKPAGFLEVDKPAGFLKVDKPAGDFLKVDKPAGDFLKVDKPAGDFLEVGKPAGFLEVDKPAGDFLNVDKPAGDFLELGKPAGFLEVDKPAGDFLKVGKPAGFLEVDKPAGDFLKVDKPAGFLEVDKPAGDFLKDDKPAGDFLKDDKPAGDFLKVDKPAGFLEVNKPAGDFLKADKPAGFLEVNKPAGDFLKADKPAGFLEVDKPAGFLAVDKPAGDFLKADKPAGDFLEVGKPAGFDKADNPAGDFLEVGKPAGFDKADNPAGFLNFLEVGKPAGFDKADKPAGFLTVLKPAGNFLEADKPAGFDKADKPAGNFLEADKPAGFDKADKPAGFLKVDKPAGLKVDKPAGFFKVDKPAGFFKVDKPAGLLQVDKPASLKLNKAHSPDPIPKQLLTQLEQSDEIDNKLDHSNTDVNLLEVVWTPENILLGTYIGHIDRASKNNVYRPNSNGVLNGRDDYENGVLTATKLGIFRNLHTKPYTIILSSTIMTFIIMRWLNPYTIFKWNRKLKNQLGTCLLVPGYDDNEESTLKKVWDNDKLLDTWSQGYWLKGSGPQKKCKDFIKSPPGDAFDASSCWIMINILFSLITMSRLMINVNFGQISIWETYELLGLFFFNSSAFMKVIAQTQPILYNCVLYWLPSGAPEDEFTRADRQKLRDQQKRDKENMTEEEKKQERERPKAQVLSQPPPEDGEEINELDQEPYDRQNYCEKRHGPRDGPKDDRLIACCYNPKKIKSGEETLISWYTLFIIPLSTEKMLDYDETFTTTTSTLVSIITLIMGFIFCVPYGITHILPMLFLYGWLTIGMVIFLIIANFIIVTLPSLKKSIEEPELDSDGNQVMEDAKADEDGNIPQEAETDEEGKTKMVNKKVVKMKRRMVDRAWRYPWPTCKAIPRAQDEDEENGEKKTTTPDEEDQKKDADEASDNKAKVDGGDEESEKKAKDDIEAQEIQAALDLANQTAGFSYALKSMLPNTNRKFECGQKKIAMKYIDFRKIMVYIIFLVLYNIMFNWAILLYMGRGYYEAMTLDWYSPSRRIGGYIQHVINSIHTMVEFVNMLF